MKVKEYAVVYDPIIRDVTLIFTCDNGDEAYRIVMTVGESMRLGRELLNVLDPISEDNRDAQARPANNT